MIYWGILVDHVSAQLKPSLPIQARRPLSEASCQDSVSQHLSDVGDGFFQSGECVAPLVAQDRTSDYTISEKIHVALVTSLLARSPKKYHLSNRY